MSGSLLVAIDGTSEAALPVPAVVHLAHALGGGLILCQTTKGPGVAAMMKLAQANDVPVRLLELGVLDSAGRLLQLAGDHRAAMICIMPLRRHPLLAWLRSQTVRQVALRAACPVLLLRAGAHRDPPFRHLLVAWDGSPAADRAVVLGIELAVALAARLTLLSISLAVPGKLPAEQLAEAREAIELTAQHSQRRLQDWCERAARAGVACAAELIPGTQPWQIIGQRFAALEADLLLLGRHVRSGLERWLEASSLDALLNREDLDVLVVP